ncbi:MAG TPA: ROK family protein [Anaerolineales bacterium]|nr:ROK family protein [Anaerolineales bacterium]
MLTHIAVDIGGTQMRAASYESQTIEPLKISRIPTRQAGQSILERLFGLIASIWPDHLPVERIAVAAPGPLDPFEGMILSAPNIPEWVNLPLSQKLEERFQVPVRLGNDANLAALGEWKFGAGRGHRHLIYLTVSTGVGSGIIIDNELLLGNKGLAAELGHVTVLRDGPLCSCGKPGHLEAVASGTAIAQWVEQELAKGEVSILRNRAKISTREIAEAAKSGDPLSVAALKRAGTFLGNAIADYLHIFNPTIVIIGGGVSRSGEFLLEPLKKAIEKDVFNPHYLDNFSIATAALGDDAGLLGALTLARGYSSSSISTYA